MLVYLFFKFFFARSTEKLAVSENISCRNCNDMIYTVKRPISTSSWNMGTIRKFIAIWSRYEIFILFFCVCFRLGKTHARRRSLNMKTYYPLNGMAWRSTAHGQFNPSNVFNSPLFFVLFLCFTFDQSIQKEINFTFHQSRKLKLNFEKMARRLLPLNDHFMWLISLLVTRK